MAQPHVAGQLWNPGVAPEGGLRTALLTRLRLFSKLRRAFPGEWEVGGQKGACDSAGQGGSGKPHRDACLF